MFDNKETSPNDKSVLSKLEIRVFVNQTKILGLKLDIPSDYPANNI